MNASRFLFIASLVALSACTTSVKTSDDGKSATVTTAQGSVTVGKDADTSKLGAPVYPGASANEGGAMSISGQAGSAAMASFKTTDDFEKVYEFYQGQMPAGSEKMKMSSGDTSTAMFAVGDDKNPKGETTSVQIVGKSGETDIIISHKDAQQ